jgi:hypothetical protein
MQSKDEKDKLLCDVLKTGLEMYLNEDGLEIRIHYKEMAIGLMKACVDGCSKSENDWCEEHRSAVAILKRDGN